MGKTPLPLIIGVEGLSLDHPVLVKLAAQGHIVVQVGVVGQLACCDPIPPLDLIIGPKCYRTLPDLKYLDVTLGQARKLKREVTHDPNHDG